MEVAGGDADESEYDTRPEADIWTITERRYWAERIERQLLRREPVRYEAPVRGQLDLRHQAGGFYF